MTDRTTAKSRFVLQHTKRGEVISRSVQAASVTIPSVFPKEGHNENSKLPKPYQGLGARLVNNLAAKLLLALYPPNTAFFKLSLDPEVEEAMKESGADLEDVMARLGKIEQAIVAANEQSKARPVLYTALKLLIVTGNALLHIDKDGQYRVFNLHNYVVERDHAGNVTEIILKEILAPSALGKLAEFVDLTDDERKDPATEIELFTWIRREGNRFKVHQELQDKVVPGSIGSYPLDAPAFIPLRWESIPGEEYGRGKVEEYQGDFDALDDLCRDLLKASANAAKIILLRKPNSTVRKKDLAAAESGDILDGNKDDIGILSLEKFADFRITLQRVGEIREELAAAFLMNSSVQRDAERVTAEEIRYVAQELEDALGGVYSMLSQELLAPQVKRLMAVLARKGKIPHLPQRDLKITITTGIEALGRGHELNKLVGALRVLADIVGPEAVAARLKFETVQKRISTALGIDLEEIFMTEEEVMQEQQRQLQAGIAQQAIPGMLQEATKAGMNV